MELDTIKIKDVGYETNITSKTLRSLSVGETVISCTDVNRIFLAKMRPRLAAHGGGHPVDNNDDE